MAAFEHGCHSDDCNSPSAYFPPNCLSQSVSAAPKQSTQSLAEVSATLDEFKVNIKQLTARCSAFKNERRKAALATTLERRRIVKDENDLDSIAFFQTKQDELLLIDSLLEDESKAIDNATASLMETVLDFWMNDESEEAEAEFVVSSVFKDLARLGAGECPLVVSSVLARVPRIHPSHCSFGRYHYPGVVADPWVLSCSSTAAPYSDGVSIFYSYLCCKWLLAVTDLNLWIAHPEVSSQAALCINAICTVLEAVAGGIPEVPADPQFFPIPASAQRLIIRLALSMDREIPPEGPVPRLGESVPLPLFLSPFIRFFSAIAELVTPRSSKVARWVFSDAWLKAASRACRYVTEDCACDPGMRPASRSQGDAIGDEGGDGLALVTSDVIPETAKSELAMAVHQFCSVADDPHQQNILAKQVAEKVKALGQSPHEAIKVFDILGTMLSAIRVISKKDYGNEDSAHGPYEVSLDDLKRVRNLGGFELGFELLNHLPPPPATDVKESSVATGSVANGPLLDDRLFAFLLLMASLRGRVSNVFSRRSTLATAVEMRFKASFSSSKLCILAAIFSGRATFGSLMLDEINPHGAGPWYPSADLLSRPLPALSLMTDILPKLYRSVAVLGAQGSAEPVREFIANICHQAPSSFVEIHRSSSCAVTGAVTSHRELSPGGNLPIMPYEVAVLAAGSLSRQSTASDGASSSSANLAKWLLLLALALRSGLPYAVVTNLTGKSVGATLMVQQFPARGLETIAMPSGTTGILDGIRAPLPAADTGSSAGYSIAVSDWSIKPNLKNSKRIRWQAEAEKVTEVIRSVVDAGLLSEDAFVFPLQGDTLPAKVKFKFEGSALSIVAVILPLSVLRTALLREDTRDLAADFLATDRRQQLPPRTVAEVTLLSEHLRRQVEHACDNASRGKLSEQASHWFSRWHDAMDRLLPLAVGGTILSHTCRASHDYDNQKPARRALSVIEAAGVQEVLLPFLYQFLGLIEEYTQPATCCSHLINAMTLLTNFLDPAAVSRSVGATVLRLKGRLISHLRAALFCDWEDVRFAARNVLQRYLSLDDLLVDLRLAIGSPTSSKIIGAKIGAVETEELGEIDRGLSGPVSLDALLQWMQLALQSPKSREFHSAIQVFSLINEAMLSDTATLAQRITILRHFGMADGNLPAVAASSSVSSFSMEGLTTSLSDELVIQWVETIVDFTEARIQGKFLPAVHGILSCLEQVIRGAANVVGTPGPGKPHREAHARLTETFLFRVYDSIVAPVTKQMMAFIACGETKVLLSDEDAVLNDEVYRQVYERVRVDARGHLVFAVDGDSVDEVPVSSSSTAATSAATLARSRMAAESPPLPLPPPRRTPAPAVAAAIAEIREQSKDAKNEPTNFHASAFARFWLSVKNCGEVMAAVMAVAWLDPTNRRHLNRVQDLTRSGLKVLLGSRHPGLLEKWSASVSNAVSRCSRFCANSIDWRNRDAAVAAALAEWGCLPFELTQQLLAAISPTVSVAPEEEEGNPNKFSCPVARRQPARYCKPIRQSLNYVSLTPGLAKALKNAHESMFAHDNTAFEAIPPPLRKSASLCTAVASLLDAKLFSQPRHHCVATRQSRSVPGGNNQMTGGVALINHRDFAFAIFAKLLLIADLDLDCFSSEYASNRPEWVEAVASSKFHGLNLIRCLAMKRAPFIAALVPRWTGLTGNPSHTPSLKDLDSAETVYAPLGEAALVALAAVGSRTDDFRIKNAGNLLFVALEDIIANASVISEGEPWKEAVEKETEGSGYLFSPNPEHMRRRCTHPNARSLEQIVRQCPRLLFRLKHLAAIQQETAQSSQEGNDELRSLLTFLSQLRPPTHSTADFLKLVTDLQRCPEGVAGPSVGSCGAGMGLPSDWHRDLWLQTVIAAGRSTRCFFTRCLIAGIIISTHHFSLVEPTAAASLLPLKAIVRTTAATRATNRSSPIQEFQMFARSHHDLLGIFKVLLHDSPTAAAFHICLMVARGIVREIRLCQEQISRESTGSSWIAPASACPFSQAELSYLAGLMWTARRNTLHRSQLLFHEATLLMEEFLITYPLFVGPEHLDECAICGEQAAGSKGISFGDTLSIARVEWRLHCPLHFLEWMVSTPPSRMMIATGSTATNIANAAPLTLEELLRVMATECKSAEWIGAAGGLQRTQSVLRAVAAAVLPDRQASRAFLQLMDKMMIDRRDPYIAVPSCVCSLSDLEALFGRHGHLQAAVVACKLWASEGCPERSQPRWAISAVALNTRADADLRMRKMAVEPLVAMARQPACRIGGDLLNALPFIFTDEAVVDIRRPAMLALCGCNDPWRADDSALVVDSRSIGSARAGASTYYNDFPLLQDCLQWMARKTSAVELLTLWLALTGTTHDGTWCLCSLRERLPKVLLGRAGVDLAAKTVAPDAFFDDEFANILHADLVVLRFLKSEIVRRINGWGHVTDRDSHCGPAAELSPLNSDLVELLRAEFRSVESELGEYVSFAGDEAARNFQLHGIAAGSSAVGVWHILRSTIECATTLHPKIQSLFLRSDLCSHFRPLLLLGTCTSDKELLV